MSLEIRLVVVGRLYQSRQEGGGRLPQLRTTQEEGNVVSVYETGRIALGVSSFILFGFYIYDGEKHVKDTPRAVRVLQRM